jgi:UDP-hydrolysing UDP-N-acetyl-D-glucosamine 2-epimerase
MPSLAVVVTARPSYARLRSLILALQASINVRLVVAGSALLERYGAVVDLIEADCGPVAWKAYTGVEGETLETSGRSTGLLMADCATAFRALQPDAVLVHADRHEVLGAAAAARMLELPLIHTQGGERTGSVDDRIRDAITQLADYHLVSTPAAKARIRQMRGHDAIVTGCPSLDVARSAATLPAVDVTRLPGDGRALKASEPFLVVLQHPTTDHAAAAHDEMATTLEAVAQVGIPAVVLWPGDEAGMAGASKAIRERRRNFRTMRNLPPETFLRLLTQSVGIVGNSSVGIRECSYLGVPAVNIGDRQANRERAGNVVDVPVWDVGAIQQAIEAHLWHGPALPSQLYGDGRSGPRMAAAVRQILGGL